MKYSLLTKYLELIAIKITINASFGNDLRRSPRMFAAKIPGALPIFDETF
jgi:hypothetical protein